MALPLRTAALLLASFALPLLAGCAGSTAIPRRGPAVGKPGDAPLPLAERVQWFEDARFGLFIHWGLYAVAEGEWNGKPVAGNGEWIMEKARIPRADYAPLVGRFNPEKFNAGEWADLMQEAGVRYFVITTKHHDGFCLFRTKENSDWNIAATPWGLAHPDTDIMAELAREAGQRGITACWYHSIMDWHHPDYGTRRGWSDWSAFGAPDPARFEKYLQAQVKEILTNYGPIGAIWFDGEWEKAWTHEQGIRLYDHCLACAPGVLVNNRVDKGRRGMAGGTASAEFKGDFCTPEQEIPPTGFGPGVYWESCMTMNETWGWKKDDHHWKSATTLVRNLCKTASQGGNYLLNVGPKPDGTIPPESVERLRAIGAWLKVNGEAIYATQAGPLGNQPWGRSTQRRLKDGTTRVYLLVNNWPADGTLDLPGLAGQPVKAAVLGDAGAGVHAEQGAQGLRLSGLPATGQPHVTVVALDFKEAVVPPTPAK